MNFSVDQPIPSPQQQFQPGSPQQFQQRPPPPLRPSPQQFHQRPPQTQTPTASPSVEEQMTNMQIGSSGPHVCNTLLLSYTIY